MKIFKLIVAALAVMSLAACNKDASENGGDPAGQKEKATLVIRISQSQPGTYASTQDEAAVTGEVEFEDNDVLVAIINKSSDALEYFKTFDGNDIKTQGNKTDQIEVVAGDKYVYVLLNTDAALTADLALGMTRAKFEKEIYDASDVDDFSVLGEFVMSNISTPTPVTCLPNVNTDVKIEVGRAVAKVYAVFDAPEADQKGGILTDVEFRIANIPVEMFRIGQFVNGQLITPNFNNEKTPTPATDYLTYYIKDGGYQNMYDITNGITNVDSFGYTIENAHNENLEGNTTRLIVRGTFTPERVVDATDGTTTSTTYTSGDSFWTVDDGSETLIYCDADPLGESWLLGGELISAEYVNGLCYYNKVWIADNSEQDSKKYSVIRNHFYRMAIKYVNGVGTPEEDDDIDIEVPIDQKSKLTVEVDILPWHLIEQNTGLEGQ